MPYAEKLPISCPQTVSFNDESPWLGRHVLLAGEERTRVNRQRLKKKETATILRRLPDALRSKCLGVSKSRIALLPPHIHFDEQCVINFYYKTNGEKTVFFEGEYQIDVAAAQDSGNQYFVVDGNNLNEAFSFVAKNGDVWVLASQQVHAVVGKQEANREVVQLYMTASVEEVIAAFAGAENK